MFFSTFSVCVFLLSPLYRSSHTRLKNINTAVRIATLSNHPVKGEWAGTGLLHKHLLTVSVGDYMQRVSISTSPFKGAKKQPKKGVKLAHYQNRTDDLIMSWATTSDTLYH
ncbi:hypothetical protein BU24DRAFT_104734 [Aaosphaeria arxii CBS 175.79]|uniref:Secreted protein n=1 Tax=Aaosphaeria arxii CBS 175.79 TaxID=1450172 RepID=A0A6A5XZP6_9PLEO|nr:uncharacterized protein BU24DRAFT_104734 [Aaosphaeria arxii CBS 175.79]KAF2018765.1 hypothetical protein BU24DRAFT_104734 [Aaosphaeria arxii CBS 175.79]